MSVDKKNYLILSSLFLFIYFFGFLTNNFYYLDDIYRSVIGVFGWDLNARPVTNFIFKLISADRVVDIYPLGLILGVLSVIWASDKIRKFLFQGHVMSGVIATLLILANPFLLANASYHYDALTMFLATALAIWATFVTEEVKSWLGLGLTCFILFLVWSTYQPAINLFLTLSVIFYIDRAVFLKTKNINIDILLKALALVLSYIIYSLSFQHLVGGAYSVQHSELLKINGSFIHQFIVHIKLFFGMIHLLFEGHFKYVAYGYALIFFMSVFYLDFTQVRKNSLKLSRFYSYILLSSPLVIIFLSFLIFCFLKEPVVKYRVMIGFSGVLVYLFYLLNKVIIKNKSHWLMIPMLVIFYIYAAVYPNAQQARYDNYLLAIHTIGERINQTNFKSKELMVAGTFPAVNVNLATKDAYPIIFYLLKSYFTDMYLESNSELLTSGANLFKHDFLTKDLNIVFKSKSAVLKDGYFHVISDTPYYTLGEKKDSFAVVFKGKE
ncbi:glucosyltransferase domain-containing protein [Celerinatantimonas yamalensis]|uniref:Glucosyltransferase domain-containing protein n=1 Tax=Celerinatantimonas yamalensis TaxID=559956 RepID=A0ABW9GB23_9GAMM